MRLSEQLSVLSPTDRIRIIEGDHGNREPQYDPAVKILFCGYKGMLAHTDAATEYLTRDPEVVRLIAFQEWRHREWERRGLMPPYEPDQPRSFTSGDMTIFLYYDIYIKGNENG